MEVIINLDTEGRETGLSWNQVPGEWSLAYIGNASARVHEEHRGSCSRRFRLGDEKEAAGAADAVIYQGPMDFE